MNLEKIMNDFVDDYQKRGVYASREELLNVLEEVKTIVTNNKDKTPEEIIDIMFEKNIRELEEIRQKYPAPGYTASINVDNITVKLYGGNINYLGEAMPSNALFDVASMTKFYTQAVAYNLIKEGVFSYTDKIKDLDPRFVNVGDLTVEDVLTFTTEFRTDGRISDKKTIDEAKDTLYKVNVVGTGKYNYNDIGMATMKEVMENVTGEKYEDLVDKYLIKPLGLKDTHLIVPNNKYHLLTGSPNVKYGKVNDMTALALGGFSGHAGIFTSSDDLLKMMKGVYYNDVVPNISDAYTHGVNVARGKMGNTYTTHPDGLDYTYLDKTETADSFVIQGSTRVNATGSFDAAHNVLFNPSSMGMERARLENEKLNERRALKDQGPLQLVKEFEFDRNGQLVKYDLIDPRQLFSGVLVEKVIKSNAEATLKLRFLNKLIKEYDKNYNHEINITKHGASK